MGCIAAAARVAACGLAVSACAPRAAPATAKPAAPVATAAPAPRPSASTTEPESVGAGDAIVAAALAKTSVARELPAKGPVRGMILGRKKLSEQVQAAVDREMPPEVLLAQGEMLVAFGVVPVDFEYRGAVVELMSEELAGYYEPLDKTMYLMADLDEAARAATLSHELVHALQDQYYDLGKLLDFRPDESDALSAVHALAEGDATSAMLDQLLEGQGLHAPDLSDALLGVQVRAAAQISSKAGSVPDILKRSLIAPYVDGTLFVHALRRAGGWTAVDQVWKAPPTTTEQLLHLDKLANREPALPVAEPPPPSGGPTTRTLSDVCGEQSLRLLFEEWLPRQVAENAAAGWGGDRGAVFHDGDLFAVAWHFVADDMRAAEREAAAFARGVVAQGGTMRGAVACAERAERGPLRVERRGRDIVLVAGPYERAARVVRSAGTCDGAKAWSARIFAGH